MRSSTSRTHPRFPVMDLPYIKLSARPATWDKALSDTIDFPSNLDRLIKDTCVGDSLRNLRSAEYRYFTTGSFMTVRDDVLTPGDSRGATSILVRAADHYLPEPDDLELWLRAHINGGIAWSGVLKREDRLVGGQLLVTRPVLWTMHLEHVDDKNLYARLARRSKRPLGPAYDAATSQAEDFAQRIGCSVQKHIDRLYP